MLDEEGLVDYTAAGKERSMRTILAVALACLLVGGSACSDDAGAADVPDARDDAAVRTMARGPTTARRRTTARDPTTAPPRTTAERPTRLPCRARRRSRSGSG